MSRSWPLEPDADEMRRLVDRAMDRIVPHVESLPRQPAADVEGAFDLARSLIEPIPEEGENLDDLLDRLFDQYVPKSFNAAGPGYLAYVPGGGLFFSAVAELIASSVNRYVGVCAAAPALVQLEANVIRWFCRIVGYPAEAGGVLSTGGSLANFTAVVTARHARVRDLARATVYASDQVHHSVVKAATLAGVPARNVRSVSSDDRFRMRVDETLQAVLRDRDSGHEPFLVVSSAGTTNTGAIDDLEALADLARDQNLWHHVDAAYGGFFMLTERGRESMRGIDRADSITLDPHKALFLPYGTGSLLVRDGRTLREAHTTHADYMPPMQQEADLVDFCELSPELSRDFRGLRVWLPFKLLGIRPFREALDEKLDLTRFATNELRRIPGVEIVAEPQLSTVAFRLVRDGWNNASLNDLNRRLIERINARRNVMLTGTMLRGEFVIRICILSFRTHRDRIEQALEDILAAVEELAGS